MHLFSFSTQHVTSESFNNPVSVKLIVPPSKKVQQDMKQESVSMLAMAGSFTSQKSGDASEYYNSNVQKSDEDSAMEEANMINFPGNSNQSESLDGKSLAEDSSDPKDIPCSSAEMYSSKLQITKPGNESEIESEDKKQAPEHLYIPAELGNNMSQHSEDNSSSLEIVQHREPDNSSESEQSGDNSLSAPEIIHVSDLDATNGSESSVNEEQYDLVSDDVSKFDEENSKKSEENGNATG